MLGRLCRWMRIVGIDTAYHRPENNINIVLRSLKEKRIIITRDLKLKNSAALKVFIIDNDDFRQQLKETVNKLDIKIDPDKVFIRCPECNTKLVGEDKKKVKGKVPDYIYKTHDKFSKCVNCEKLYWKGTHQEMVNKILRDIQK